MPCSELRSSCTACSTSTFRLFSAWVCAGASKGLSSAGERLFSTPAGRERRERFESRSRIEFER